MSYLIAAAGTGGHVFPGLAVGEALVELGVARDQVLFVGGDRLEQEVYPGAGFPFLRTEIAGLKRELTLANLRLPRTFWEASVRIGAAMAQRRVAVVLAMGGYVTVPVAMAARRGRVPLFIAEQNASAGLANRFASRWATRVFGSFPVTDGLPKAEWIGNPIRSSLRLFDRIRLRTEAQAHFDLVGENRVVGVIGGSLGAGALNRVAALLAASSPRYAILNICGAGNEIEQQEKAEGSRAKWIVRGFEPRIELFYAAVEAVVARAGGAVAELTATATPSVLIPGGFGSGGHQEANAAFLAATGAALLLSEDSIEESPKVVEEMLSSSQQLRMTEATKTLARPNAALDVAAAMRAAHEDRSR
ncbi:MAG: UDP-N-acetylglucosamine--N-acetylmuramyl-(pentapeptide) pyrophosphoryl-undecaprenol N-acetylglucosamine transferase [Acidimicrobiia bacterium]